MTYDLHDCLLYLRPGAAFGTTDNDYALTEWKGPGTMPTESECIAAWPLVQAEQAREIERAAILAQLAANDAERGVRAITDALAGDTRRLDSLRADQAALRARLA